MFVACRPDSGERTLAPTADPGGVSMRLMTVLMFLMFGASVSAALIDNGDGTITQMRSDGSALTWLQDANLSMTTGHAVSGSLNWFEALDWADTLVFAGHDDWRLPSAFSSDGTGPCLGTTLCNDSEMGALFYIDGVSGATPGLFTNVVGSYYWSSTGNVDETENAWQFHFGADGLQVGNNDKIATNGNAWAVRDVVPVSESPAVGLLIVALVLLRGSRVATFTGLPQIRSAAS